MAATGSAYKQTIRTISGWSLVLLFAFYFANISFFYHIHEIDGQLVVHSHFYGGGSSSNPGHTHSPTNFSAFASLALLLALGLGLGLAMLTRVFRPEFKRCIVPVAKTRWAEFHAGEISRRGPPSVY